jgi:hypothetical protein
MSTQCLEYDEIESQIETFSTLINSHVEFAKLAIKHNPLNLKLLHRENQTHELLKLAFEKNGNLIYLADKNKLNQELCDIAVYQHYTSFEYVPEEYRHNEMKKHVLKKNGHMITKIKNPDYELTKETTRLHPQIFPIIKPEFQTEELFLVYLMDILFKIPLFRIKIYQSGSTFQFNPEKCSKEELVKIGLEKDGLLIKYLKKQTLELAQIAFTQNSLSYEFIQDKFRTTEMRLELSKTGHFDLIDKDKQTVEMCQFALERDITMF